LLLSVGWSLFPGKASAAQGVTLEWDANRETNVVGYRLYYGPRSCGGVVGCQYARSAFIAAPTTRYTVTDLDFSPGITNYFAVTALNRDGLESLPSGEISYVAPLADNPAAAGLLALLTESLVVTPSPQAQPATPIPTEEIVKGDFVQVPVDSGDVVPSGSGPRLEITPIGAPPFAVRVTFEAPMNAACELQACENGADWLPLLTFVTGSISERLDYHDPVGSANTRFYRLVVR
jgi:hypothetical protein